MRNQCNLILILPILKSDYIKEDTQVKYQKA